MLRNKIERSEPSYILICLGESSSFLVDLVLLVISITGDLVSYAYIGVSFYSMLLRFCRIRWLPIGRKSAPRIAPFWIGFFKELGSGHGNGGSSLPCILVISPPLYRACLSQVCDQTMTFGRFN